MGNLVVKELSKAETTLTEWCKGICRESDVKKARAAAAKAFSVSENEVGIVKYMLVSDIRPEYLLKNTVLGDSGNYNKVVLFLKYGVSQELGDMARSICERYEAKMQRYVKVFAGLHVSSRKSGKVKCKHCNREMFRKLVGVENLCIYCNADLLTPLQRQKYVETNRKVKQLEDEYMAKMDSLIQEATKAQSEHRCMWVAAMFV